MAHEKSTTFELEDGRWANFKTVFGGKQVSDDVVRRMYDEGRLKPLGGKKYPTREAAVAAAEKRSDSFDKEQFIRNFKP